MEVYRFIASKILYKFYKWGRNQRSLGHLLGLLDVIPCRAGRRSLAFCAHRFSAAQARLSACRRPAPQLISGEVWMEKTWPRRFGYGKVTR